MAMTKETFYGSGKVYSMKAPAAGEDGVILSKETILATLKTLMTEGNQIGYLKNGFTFSVETQTLSDKSDLGEMKIDTITDEEGKCTFSIFNCNIETIANQYPTASYSAIGDGAYVTEVGGIENMDDSSHVIAFHHHDTEVGDTIAVCLGKNMSGFENAWKQDSVTPFSCTFNAQPYDDSGRFYMLIHTPVSYEWDDFKKKTKSTATVKTEG